MKPAPAAELLPTGHEWRVIAPDDWWPLAGLKCRAGIDDEYAMCNEPSIASSSTTLDGRSTARSQGVPYCAEHIGSIRWIDGDRVMAWRAFPIEVTG